MCGCSKEERDYSVQIVLPPSYQGLFRIQFSKDGEKQVWSNKTLVYTIPKSGVLVTRGENPFLKWGAGLTVVYDNGDEIPAAFRQENPPKDAVLFRTVGGTNDGKEWWAVIGTQEEKEKATLKLNDYQNELYRSGKN